MALGARFVAFGGEDEFPHAEVERVVFDALRRDRQSTVAIMADGINLDRLHLPDSARLDPKRDYRWSGYLVQRKVQKRAKRVIFGTYAGWFQWYMRYQRFRAFHAVVLIEPRSAVSDGEVGGYVDGLLARLQPKIRTLVIVSKDAGEVHPSTDERRTKEVVRALLYGTRLTRPEVLRRLGLTFVPISDATVAKVFPKHAWRISKRHPRYQLDEYEDELVQGMVPWFPPGYVDGKPDQIEQHFRRERRFKRELEFPDDMLASRALEDAGRSLWVTAPYESEKLREWLELLNKKEDIRLEKVLRLKEEVPADQWQRLLSPSSYQVRRVLDRLASEGKLEKRKWYREQGRPAMAYVERGKAPFSENRCGRCAFYAPAKRRCNLWWLANKTEVFYGPKWKQPGSHATRFELHKMRYSSRIGPRSSACFRFLDKKRDHLRKAIPDRCEICGQALSGVGRVAVTCLHCKTEYVKTEKYDSPRVRVRVAYEHEFNRVYTEVTGGVARTDMQAWKKKVKEEINSPRQGSTEDREDSQAEEHEEAEAEPPRVWQEYDAVLQAGVDRLALETDITKFLSIAMAESALNATRRIAQFAKLNVNDVALPVARIERYLGLIRGAPADKFLQYEAQVMKQYWQVYGLAVAGTELWVGPRKRSRFVRELVNTDAGRATGYSPMDSAINCLHQRRLRQAERVNREVGYAGRCDGFLHRRHHNSRRNGLVFDLIDPFKFADREELLLVALDRGLTWENFGIETDRRGSTFYYPMSSSLRKLNEIGESADNLVVEYEGRAMRLIAAYRLHAERMLERLGAQRVSEASDVFILRFPAG